MAEVRIGIIGMGIGRANGAALANHPRGRVVALCDLYEDRMLSFAKELPEPVQLFTDYNEMCASAEIDAVFVGTPNQLHVPVALAAIRHGKHVLVTKPLADTVDAARQVVDAAEAAGVVNMMSLSTRFAADVQYAGRRVQQGDLGDVYYARARSVRRVGIPAWNLGFIRRGGGAFLDMGVHALDAAWWLLGMPEPVSVTGVAGARFGPRGEGFMGHHILPAAQLAAEFAVDDYATGFIRFANGAALQVESFWASHQRAEFQIELFGDQAGASLYPMTFYRTVDGALQDTVVEVPNNTRESRWENVADHFIASILDGVPCAAPLRHGLIVQRMMDALLTSAATGQEVRLDE